MQLDVELDTEKLFILSLIGVGTILEVKDDTTKMGIYELIACVEKRYKESRVGSRLISGLLMGAKDYAKNKHN